MAKRNDTDTPLAYLITFRTYGTWLHGDERGSVDKNHNKFGTRTAESRIVREQQGDDLPFFSGDLNDIRECT